MNNKFPQMLYLPLYKVYCHLYVKLKNVRSLHQNMADHCSHPHLARPMIASAPVRDRNGYNYLINIFHSLKTLSIDSMRYL